MTGARREAMLRTEGLSKSYTGVPAADAVSLTLRAGERVGVIGPNGAGKSTLLGLLVGTVRPDEGRTFLDDTELTKLAPHSRISAGIARAAQIPQTFHRLSVADNVRVAAVHGASLRGEQARNWVDEVLEMCGLIDSADISAGRLGLLSRKRLELAKAIATRPKVLLLDEVAAGLTEPEIETIVALVDSLSDGRAILWVEHIPFALRSVCERLIVMDKGRKILDGAFADVWADPGLQEIYMGVPDATLS